MRYVGIFLALLWALLAYRLHLGVDFTDESFYVGLAYRFAQGDLPFRDEWSLLQPAGVLLAPWVWLYTKIVGGTFGLVLFCRALYLAFSTAIFLLLQRWLARDFDRRDAALASFLVVAYGPINIYNFSYNSLGLLFLTVGLFLLASPHAILPEPTRARAGGVVLGLAACVYPSYSVVFLFTLMLYLRARGPRDPFCRNLVVGATLPVAFFLAVLLVGGLASLGKMWALVTSFEVYTTFLPKLHRNLNDIYRHRPWPGTLLLLFGLALYLRQRSLAWTALAITSLAVAVFTQTYNGWNTASGVVAYGFPITLIWAWTFRTEKTQPWLHFVALPSLLAGTISAWSSTNGFLNAALGFSPGFVCTILCLAQNLRDRFTDVSPARGALAAFCLTALPSLAILLALYSGASYYRDVGLKRMTEWAPGPYAGMRTSFEKAQYLRRLERAVQRFCPFASHAAFEYPLVGAYLFTGRRAAPTTLWLPDLKPPTNLVLGASHGLAEPLMVVRAKQISSWMMIPRRPNAWTSWMEWMARLPGLAPAFEDENFAVFCSDHRTLGALP